MRDNQPKKVIVVSKSRSIKAVPESNHQEQAVQKSKHKKQVKAGQKSNHQEQAVPKSNHKKQVKAGPKSNHQEQAVSKSKHKKQVKAGPESKELTREKKSEADKILDDNKYNKTSYEEQLTTKPSLTRHFTHYSGYIKNNQIFKEFYSQTIDIMKVELLKPYFYDQKIKNVYLYKIEESTEGYYVKQKIIKFRYKDSNLNRCRWRRSKPAVLSRHYKL